MTSYSQLSASTECVVELPFWFFLHNPSFWSPPPQMHLLVTFLSPNSPLTQMISMALHKRTQKTQPDVFLGFQEGREVSELNLDCYDVAKNSFCTHSVSVKMDLKAKHRN